MPHGKPRDPGKEQHWRRLIDQWQRSGLSVRAFCQRQHLALPSFYAWRRTLRLRDAAVPPPTTPVTFLPVRVQEADADTVPPLELMLADGRCLRIPHGYDPDHLRALLQTLEGRPC